MSLKKKPLVLTFFSRSLEVEEAPCGVAEIASSSTLRRCHLSSSPSARCLRLLFQSARSSTATFVSTVSTMEVQILSSASLMSGK